MTQPVDPSSEDPQQGAPRARSLAIGARLLVVGSGVCILMLMLIPAEAWREPKVDGTYSGFDPRLVSAIERGFPDPNEGTVRITDSRLTLEAAPNSRPSAHLATTTFKVFTVAAGLSASAVATQADDPPIRFGVWSPRSGTGFFVSVGSETPTTVATEVVHRGQTAQSLLGGDVARRERAVLPEGREVRVHFDVNKDQGRMSVVVTEGGLEVLRDELHADDAPALFNSVRLSVTATAVGGDSGGTVLSLSDYRLTLGHQRFWVNLVDDQRLAIAMWLLFGLSTIALGLQAYLAARTTRRWLTREVARKGAAGLLAAALCTAAVIGAARPLVKMPGQVFDQQTERVASTVAASYGIKELYLRANTVPAPDAWRGAPYHEAVFPYGPGLAVYFKAVGELSQMWPTSNLDRVIKAANLAFALMDGLVIFLLLQPRVSRRWAFLCGAGFVLNPATLFSAAVWGQTHTVSLLPVLLGLLALQRGRIWVAWVMCILTATTRPQMLIPAAILALLLLRQNGLKRSVHPLALAMCVVWVLAFPILTATAPSVFVDVFRNQVAVQQSGQNEAILTTVSLDAYSVWPLLTLFAEGEHEQGRVFFQSREQLVGPLTYQMVSSLLVLTSLGLLALKVLRLPPRHSTSDAALLVAAGTVSFLILQTGLAATHFLIALPFLLLVSPYLRRRTAFFLYAAWTVLTVLPMAGSYQFALLSAGASAGVNESFGQLLRGAGETWSRDSTITLGCELALMTMVVLWVVVLRKSRPSQGPSTLVVAANSPPGVQVSSTAEGARTSTS